MIKYTNLGYTKPLFVLAFDHRRTFLKAGIKPSELVELKRIIYEGFKFGLTKGIPQAEAAILVDEEFGDEILRDAKTQGYLTILTTEKSGQEEYEFEYGQQFAEHIEKYQPTFTKALVRYNPDGDQELNRRQRERLKVLSDWSHEHGYKFLIELLMPTFQGDKEDLPKLLVQTIKEMQDDGIEPDVWKIEGLEEPRSYEAVVRQIKAGGRDQVNAVVLGRAADRKQVERWLRAGRGVPGIIGFAIGRTIFWEPLLDFKQGKINEQEASQKIGEDYWHFYKVFTNETGES